MHSGSITEFPQQFRLDKGGIQRGSGQAYHEWRFSYLADLAQCI
jgi:hypothetical protein